MEIERCFQAVSENYYSKGVCIMKYSFNSLIIFIVNVHSIFLVISCYTSKSVFLKANQSYYIFHVVNENSICVQFDKIRSMRYYVRAVFHQSVVVLSARE